jgi:hypothetical protein
MVDLDLKDFAEEDQKKKAKAVLERALNKSLQNIKEITDGNSTVLWIGNGYHVTNHLVDLF